MTDWQKTTNRCVLFIDILGFKDLVQRNDHDIILKSLETLKATIDDLDNFYDLPSLKKYNFSKDQTRPVVFSDSIILFSKGDELKDVMKIVFDAYLILRNATEGGVAIKGAISFGKITVDFAKSIFFGQPIIDAYLMHEDLKMLTIVLDNNIERKIIELPNSPALASVLTEYKANMKYENVTHTILKPQSLVGKDKFMQDIDRNCLTISGSPRIYIDNTKEFLKSLKEEDFNISSKNK